MSKPARHSSGILYVQHPHFPKNSSSPLHTEEDPCILLLVLRFKEPLSIQTSQCLGWHSSGLVFKLSQLCWPLTRQNQAVDQFFMHSTKKCVILISQTWTSLGSLTGGLSPLLGSAISSPICHFGINYANHFSVIMIFIMCQGYRRSLLILIDICTISNHE